MLRSGWLLTGRIPASPPFAMPATLAAGVAARAIDDPGALFLVLRLLTSVSVLAALAWAARRASASAGQAAAAVCLTLLSYAFVAHGVEFRYDAAILLGLLVAFGLVVRARETDFPLLGGAAAFVAAHHVKGLLLGAAVFAFGVARSAGDRRKLVRLVSGAGVVAAAWLAVAAACGILPDVFATDVVFSRLGASTARLWPWQSSVATTFVRDLTFWLAAFAAAIGAILEVVRLRPPGWREDADVWALLFLAVTLGFPFIHPMPWPYMLALPAPFAAILLARRGAAWARGPARLPALAAVAAAVGFQTFAAHSPVGAAYWNSLGSPANPRSKPSGSCAASRRLRSGSSTLREWPTFFRHARASGTSTRSSGRARARAPGWRKSRRSTRPRVPGSSSRTDWTCCRMRRRRTSRPAGKGERGGSACAGATRASPNCPPSAGRRDHDVLVRPHNRPPMPRVTVLGAGLVGAFVARTLAEDGFDVTAYDRSEAALGALAGVPRLATRRADLSSRRGDRPGRRGRGRGRGSGAGLPRPRDAEDRPRMRQGRSRTSPSRPRTRSSSTRSRSRRASPRSSTAASRPASRTSRAAAPPRAATRSSRS